jgi:hypothetical protein
MDSRPPRYVILLLLAAGHYGHLTSTMPEGGTAVEALVHLPPFALLPLDPWEKNLAQSEFAWAQLPEDKGPSWVDPARGVTFLVPQADTGPNS